MSEEREWKEIWEILTGYFNIIKTELYHIKKYHTQKLTKQREREVQTKIDELEAILAEK
jgi:hypothetical protein